MQTTIRIDHGLQGPPRGPYARSCRAIQYGYSIFTRALLVRLSMHATKKHSHWQMKQSARSNQGHRIYSGKDVVQTPTPCLLFSLPKQTLLRGDRRRNRGDGGIEDLRDEDKNANGIRQTKRLFAAMHYSFGAYGTVGVRTRYLCPSLQEEERLSASAWISY